MTFKKGDPNINRNGRPKRGTTYTDLLKEKLPPEEFTKILDRLAREGNESILKHIYDRFEGKVPDKHEITGEDGEPVQHRIEIVKKND